MKKTIIILATPIVLCTGYLSASAQAKSIVSELYTQIDQEQEELRVQREQQDSTNLKYLPIATTHMYNKLAAADVSGSLTTELSSASLSNFASLKMDNDNARVVFIPYNFDLRGKDPYAPLSLSGNVGIDASVNDKSIFNIVSDKKFNKDFNLFFNINFWSGSHNTYSNIEYNEYKKNIYDKLKDYNDCLKQKYEQAGCNCNRDEDIRAQYLKDSYAKEMELVQQYTHWRRHRHWWTLSATPVGYQALTGFDSGSRKTVDLGYFNPSLSIGFNYLLLEDARKPLFFFNSIFFSATVKAGIVNTFSEISPKDWYSINKFSDSTQLLLNDKGSVYPFDPAKFEKKLMPSANIQLIAMKNLGRRLTLGIDLNYQANMLVPVDGQQLMKHYFSEGLVIPFKDKEGKSTINIEIFHASTFYSAARFDKKEVVGVKFSVPIPGNKD